jgi:uncharacterized protein
MTLANVPLLSDSTPKEVLSVDALHGYLTAIVCCPVPVMPSDWLNGVWQTEAGPPFESAEQAQEILSLITRMHNAIADALDVGEAFGPLMLENTLETGETVVVGQGWCRGFMEGMRSQFDAWEPHLDMLNELVVPIAVLARFGDDDPERQALLDDRQKIAQLTDGIAESGPQSTPAAAPLPKGQDNRTGARPPRWGATIPARAAAEKSR